MSLSGFMDFWDELTTAVSEPEASVSAMGSAVARAPKPVQKRAFLGFTRPDGSGAVFARIMETDVTGRSREVRWTLRDLVSNLSYVVNAPPLSTIQAQGRRQIPVAQLAGERGQAERQVEKSRAVNELAARQAAAIGKDADDGDPFGLGDLLGKFKTAALVGAAGVGGLVVWKLYNTFVSRR